MSASSAARRAGPKKNKTNGRATEREPISERRPKLPEAAHAPPVPAPQLAEEEDDPWERAGLNTADFHAVDDHAYRAKLPISALFSAFLGAYDDDPIEAGMLSLADELDALVNTSRAAIDGDETICLPDSFTPAAVHRCAARLRVLAELHRRAVE